MTELRRSSVGVAFALVCACRTADEPSVARTGRAGEHGAIASSTAGVASVMTARGELERVLREAGIELVLATAETKQLDTTACDVTKDAQCVRCRLAAPTSELHPAELAAAIRVAPASFAKTAGLKRLAICDELTYVGDHGPDPGGTIDFARGMLLVKRPAMTTHYSSAVLQHELYHLFDAPVPARDKAWLALNPRGFRYGDGRERPGFARPYGMTNVREDKATVYEAIIDQALCNDADAILIAKGRLVRTRIRDAIGDDAKFIDELAPCLVPP